MRRTLKAKRGVVIAFLLGLALATATTATAATMITSKQIKNGTITMKDLSSAVRAKINAPGPAGPARADDTLGQPGPAGIPGGFSTDNTSIVTGNQATFPVPFPGGNRTLCARPARWRSAVGTRWWAATRASPFRS
ncbi:MAG: hypothetical protein IPG68_08805 [Micrococcales bacterium]|nr:hypothetical protein [Micrococcales bacterium]